MVIFQELQNCAVFAGYSFVSWRWTENALTFLFGGLFILHFHCFYQLPNHLRNNLSYLASRLREKLWSCMLHNVITYSCHPIVNKITQNFYNGTRSSHLLVPISVLRKRRELKPRGFRRDDYWARLSFDSWLLSQRQMSTVCVNQQTTGQWHSTCVEEDDIALFACRNLSTIWSNLYSANIKHCNKICVQKKNSTSQK